MRQGFRTALIATLIGAATLVATLLGAAAILLAPSVGAPASGAPGELLDEGLCLDWQAAYRRVAAPHLRGLLGGDEDGWFMMPEGFDPERANAVVRARPPRCALPPRGPYPVRNPAWGGRGHGWETPS